MNELSTTKTTLRDVLELYHELLYAVARKFPGESRHETALRYIRDTEERVCEAGSCKQNSSLSGGASAQGSVEEAGEVGDE